MAQQHAAFVARLDDVTLPADDAGVRAVRAPTILADIPWDTLHLLALSRLETLLTCWSTR